MPPGRIGRADSDCRASISCRGLCGRRSTSASERAPAAKSRPLEKASPAPMAATMALEMIGPTSGTLISRPQPTSWRVSFERPAIRSSSRCQSPGQILNHPHHARRQNVGRHGQDVRQLGTQEPLSRNRFFSSLKTEEPAARPTGRAMKQEQMCSTTSNASTTPNVGTRRSVI